ncbi:MAG: hypothetical protein ACJA2D_000412 [Pseudohongiellaceae bacterium]|jgi:hypothetical protein
MALFSKFFPKYIALGITIVFLSSCAQSPPPPPVVILMPSVGSVELLVTNQAPSESVQLEIGIQVFDNRLDAEDRERFEDWVYSEIRENEVNYLPYVLRNTLLETNHWGAVRVLPQPDPSVDIQIEGTVLHSDGDRLEIDIVATDSAGRQWLNKTYADTTVSADFPDSTRFTTGNPFNPNGFVDPFQDIYDQIANDLLLTRELMASTELVNIKRVSQMVYASDLSPETFAHTLTTDEQGLLTVTSLLSETDPMLERLESMRDRHLVFIDTVDEYYEALYTEMQPSYVIWRRYSHDQIDETQRLASRAEDYDLDDYGTSSSFVSLTQRYDRYRWSKIYEQEFRELAAGFNKELAPAILNLSEQVNGVSGTMEEQYVQWRRILQALFRLETEEM